MITRAFQTPVRDGNNFAKLFNKLQEDGKYSKSFEDFEAQFGNDEGAARLHAKLTEDGVYTKSFDDFKTQFDVGVEKVKDTSFDTRMLAAGIDINSANNKGTSNNKILEGSIANIGTDQEMPEFDDPTTKEIEGQKDKYGMSRAFWQGQTETNPFMEGFDAKRDPDGGIPSLSDFFVVDPNMIQDLITAFI